MKATLFSRAKFALASTAKRYLGPPYVRRALAAEGHVTYEEAELLYQLARDVNTGCIIEIGSFRGRSTIALGLGSVAGSAVPVFAIEPHEEFRGVFGGRFGPGDRVAFMRNIVRAGVGEVVRLINLASVDVARGWSREVSLLWVDGDHSYEAVKADFEAWEPHVKVGGLIGFHDSLDENLGPFKVIALVLEEGRMEVLQRLGQITIMRKLR